jgi:hypothetical protein
MWWLWRRFAGSLSLRSKRHGPTTGPPRHSEIHEALDNKGIGGDGGIRTLDRPLQAYNGLANRRLQPLGHVSSKADMPEVRLSRKRQIARFVQNHSTPIDLVAWPPTSKEHPARRCGRSRFHPSNLSESI